MINWIHSDTYIEIIPPVEFSYEQCLVFLRRSDLELMYQIQENDILQVVSVDSENLLIKISYSPHRLRIDFLTKVPSITQRQKIASYIWGLFDFNQNLTAFYEMASQEVMLQPLIEKYYGLRIIGIPDLFEAVTWAIMGQQINLKFAYLLKRRFVEHYGERVSHDGKDYWIYPSFHTIASLETSDLRKLQFSTSKASYIIGFAKLMREGEITKEELLRLKPQQMKETLLQVKGIGHWTADYVLMKCFHIPTAFPIADAGLHQAIQKRLGFNQKPTIGEVKEISKNWNGWQAYVTFYLWRSLYD